MRNHSFLILQDDFNSPTGWTLIPESGANAYLLNGHYHITHSLANRNVRVVTPVSGSDIPGTFAVKTTVSLAPGSDGGTRVGILFNWVDQFHFYRYLINPATQEFWIYKFQQTWVTLAHGYSTAINATGENTLLLVRDGVNIHAYANDTLLTSLLNESTYLQGGVGLTILTSPTLAPPTIANAAFDFFTLWEPSW